MSKRILVVDDDRNIGQILHASFSAKGYETIVSGNGEDALEQFDEVRPDLVLLDVLLPKMNGWEVCKKIKETEYGKSTPIILMSAIYKNFKMQTDSKIKYGADGFLEKPFQLSNLLTTVAGYIGQGDQAAPAQSDEDDQETTPDKPKVLMNGDMTTLTFAEILHSVYVMGKSGILVMKNGEVEKEIAVNEGYPVSIKTNIEKELFGNYLVRMRKITKEQCEKGLELQKESTRLLGTILIEMEAITPQELVHYLKLQMRDKIFEIFSWREGEFEFTQDNSVTGDISAIDMSTANIIFFGIKKYFDLDYSLDRLLPYIDKYLRAGSNQYYKFQELELTPSESKLLMDIDGTKTVDEIISNSPLSPEETYHIILALCYSGMCEPSNEKSETPDNFFNSIIETEDEENEAPTRQMSSTHQDTPIDSKTDESQSEQRANIIIDLDQEVTEEEATTIIDNQPGSEGQPSEDMVEMKPKDTVPTSGPEADKIKLAKNIEEKFGTLKEANFFQILQTSNNPTEHEVRVAYHKLAKNYHPDKFFGNVSSELKMKVEEIFRAISDAYEELNTQEKINSYLAKLEGDQSIEERQSSRLEGVKKIILAEQHYQNGLNFLREKRYTRSTDAFKKAVDITNDPEYIAHLGWAMYNMPYEKDLDEEELAIRGNDSHADFQFQAREHLNRAIQISPRTEKAYIFLGHIYKRQGLKEFAEKQFEKALICNPNSIEALRELRLIKLEDQKKEKPKSFFEKLFVKK